MKHAWLSERKQAIFWDIMPGFTPRSPDEGISVDIICDSQLIIYMGSLPLPPPSPTSDYINKYIFKKMYMEGILKGEEKNIESLKDR